MKIIAVANQKGGVGKTTTTAHIAWGLAKAGKRVLGIDLDGQANFTQAILGSGLVREGAFELFTDSPVSPIKTKHGIDILPANEKLHDVDSFPLSHYNYCVTAIKALSEDYDYIVIDTPPSLGLRLTAALAVATDVIIPIACNWFSIAGLNKLSKTIDAVRLRINKQIKISAYVPNLFRGTKKHKSTLELLLKRWPNTVISTPLRYSEYIETAVEEGHPVWEKAKLGGQRNAAANMTQVITGILEKVGE